MTRSSYARLDATLDALPSRYSGPGGAVAVLKDGNVLAKRAWGWADAAQRLPFTDKTPFLVCSITKQFTCALLLDLFPDPSVLDADLRQFMPKLEGPFPTVRELCHNQSGLRDYWALAMLCGPPVEGYFGPDEARRLIGGTRSLHFAPGTRYSYVNQNFRLVADLIAARTGQDYATLLRSRILERAGMPDAALNPDTSAVRDGTVGYEGTAQGGFFPAVNRIVWTGDAGLAASLEDMIAWERFIDATRDEADGLYRRLSAPQTFRGGAPAAYGFGLRRDRMLGREITGHGGGLRGWRSMRLYAPAERVSVVVLFNHMADAHAAAEEVFGAALDLPPSPSATPGDAAAWAGRFIDPESGLATRLEPLANGKLALHFARAPEALTADGAGAWSGSTSRITRDADGVRMERPSENIDTRLLPVEAASRIDIEGAWHCDELGATFTVTLAGGVPYAAFSGDLGDGEMLALVPFAQDVWLMPCPRALYYAAPGDWTVIFQRDSGGRIGSVQLGCWLARKVVYRAV